MRSRSEKPLAARVQTRLGLSSSSALQRSEVAMLGVESQLQPNVRIRIGAEIRVTVVDRIRIQRSNHLTPAELIVLRGIVLRGRYAAVDRLRQRGIAMLAASATVATKVFMAVLQFASFLSPALASERSERPARHLYYCARRTLALNRARRRAPVRHL
jgi:hypothetical protein